MGSRIGQAWITLPLLPLPSWGTWASGLTSLSLSFLRVMVVVLVVSSEDQMTYMEGLGMLQMCNKSGGCSYCCCLHTPISPRDASFPHFPFPTLTPSNMNAPCLSILG